MTTYIYALIDPRTSECRYVGKANNPAQRIKEHITHSKFVTHKVHWIKSLRALNIQPTIVILDEVSVSEWVDAEMFWIAYMKFLGARLTNCNLGGTGNAGFKLSPESRAKISKSKTGVKVSLERKKQLQELLQSIVYRPDVVAKKQAYYKSEKRPEVLEKIAAAGRGRVKSEATLKKMSDINKGRVFSQQHLDRLSTSHKGKLRTEDAKRKTSEALKGVPKTLEHNRRVSEAIKKLWADPEHKKKVSDAIKAHWILRRRRKDNP